jgi:hypothetical protein
MSEKIVTVSILTMESMQQHSWEPALTFKIPKNATFDVLAEARQQVLTFLDFTTHHAIDNHEDTVRDIHRAANRLIEIAELWPAACDPNPQPPGQTATIHPLKPRQPD